MDDPDTPNDGFAALLRAALLRHGTPLEVVRQEMAARGHDLSITTLSYWQNGRSLPTRASSLAGLADLETLLDLPEGALLERAARDRRPRRRTLPTDTIASDPRLAEEMNETALDLGLRWLDGLDRLSVHAGVTLDEHGSQREHTLRQIVQARRTVERIPAAFYWDHPELPARLTARAGCRVGEVRIIPRFRLGVAEIVLDPPLPPRQTRQLEYTFAEAAPPPRVTTWEIGFMTPVRVMHLQADFHPDRVPSCVWSYGPDPDEPPVEVKPDGVRHVSRVVLDAAPGAHGLRWTW